jgi:hypothetical protein
VTDTFEAARAIIDSALDHPDPEGAMERLEAEAPEDERFMFVMLWEGLALALNDKPR